MGLRSPGGPMRGRSVKEFDEQLASLKKENFNLKLRIYFLEERMGSNFNLDKENIVKKNVELMVEVESLKKELQEKHDLLCQAVKAMELEDEEHKKLVNEKDEMLSDYQQEIESLKTQLLTRHSLAKHDVKPESGLLSSKSSDVAELLSCQAFNIQQENSSSVLKDLQEKINTLEEELNREKENNAAIQMILDQTNSKIKTLMAELDQANDKLSSREDDLRDMSFRLEETKAKCQGLHKKLQEKSQLVDEVSSENDQLRKRHAILVADLEKERKRYEKLKATSDQKVADLQCKLEASLTELKKSQELVVSKSPARRPGNTDADSFSVQKPATPPRSPQKDTFLHASVPSPVLTPVSSPSSSVNFSFENGVDLKHVIEQLKIDRDAQQQKIVKLKAEQMKACKIIKSMIDSRNKTNEEIAALKEKNDELERELEGVVSKLSDKGSDVSDNNNLRKENSMDEQSGELVEHYKALTDELEEKNRILLATLNEKDSQMKRIQEQYEEMLKNNKEKEEHIVDLEFELLTVSQEKSTKVDEEGGEENSEKDIDYYVKQIKEKDEEIEHLNAKLQKRNCDLQGLVNNELWEKNREIEKLQKKQATKLIENKDHEIQTLQNDLKTKEDQLKIIKEKISELGIEIDLQSGDINVENNLQIELEKSEKLRSEANEVCGVLSKRLEELAIFLDSLLKQKSVLGFLGNKENKRLRQIIDQSLDLSRSFTMSMIINPEQSLMQLTNITSLLNDTDAKFEDEEDEASASRLSIIPANVSLTYRSHLYKKDNEDNSQIIQTLRQQIVNLKYELQLRDVELNKMNGGSANLTEVSSEKEEVAQKSMLNTTSTTLKYKSDNQSESEAWSEPDRSVSRARIGLLDGSLRSNANKKETCHSSTDSTEDEGTRSSRTPSKKGVLNESRSTILELHKQVCELDQKLNVKEQACYEATETNDKLKQELENLEIKLQDTEDRLVQVESRKYEAESKAENLQKEKEELLETLNMKDKELQNRINNLEVEKLKVLSVAKEAEEAAEIAKNEMKMAEMKLRSLQEQMSEMEINLRREYQNDLMEKLQIVESESLKKIKQIQNGAEMEIKTLHETIKQLKLEYSAN
ncbi:centrosomin, partial [Asbolus verrucosus]